MLKNKFPRNIRYLLHVYLTGIIVFAAIRFVLVLVQWDTVRVIPSALYEIGYAFLMGWRFDTAISGYLILPAFVLLAFWRISKSESSILPKITYFYLNTVYILAFFICMVDVPYFAVFSARLNVAVLAWTSNLGFGISMIVQEPINWAYVFVFLSLSYVFYYHSRKAFYRIVLPEKTIFTYRRRTVVLLSVFFLGLLILGIRGRLTEKSPIRVGTAYFSEYAFPNQLGLNPVFTFFKSYLEANKSENKYLTLMDEKLAIAMVSGELGANAGPNSIARKVVSTKQEQHPNVVLVIMESMTAAKLHRFGNNENLTPFLDSIANNGYSFDNVFSAGIHTYNGIYSTLYSQPALLRQHPMNKTIMQRHTGFAKVLREKGYNSIYFTTHDEQFDNVGGFLTNSYFQRIVSQKDYPISAVQSTLGVPDHYLFDYSVPILDGMANAKKPFFATFMTASDHMPYIIPGGLDANFGNDGIEQQIVRYADWSLKRFVDSCSQKTWFENTVFIFVSDHGLRYGPVDYDPPICQNHIPFIVYSPSVLKEKKQVPNVGSQIDVFPTVMGLLGMSYTNNTLGVDLINQKRKYTYYCADDKVCCMSDSLLYIYRLNGPESLHKFKHLALENVIDKYPNEAIEMRKYAFSMLQTSQWMVKNNKTD